MPIVTTNTEVSTQANGGRQVIVRSYDQDGREYMYSFYAAPGLDIATVVANKTADMNVQLAQAEFEELVGAA